MHIMSPRALVLKAKEHHNFPKYINTTSLLQAYTHITVEESLHR